MGAIKWLIRMMHFKRQGCRSQYQAYRVKIQENREERLQRPVAKGWAEPEHRAEYLTC